MSMKTAVLTMTTASLVALPVTAHAHAFGNSVSGAQTLVIATGPTDDGWPWDLADDGWPWD